MWLWKSNTAFNPQTAIAKAPSWRTKWTNLTTNLFSVRNTRYTIIAEKRKRVDSLYASQYHWLDGLAICTCTRGARGVLGRLWPPLFKAFFKQTTDNRRRKRYDNLVSTLRETRSYPRAGSCLGNMSKRTKANKSEQNERSFASPYFSSVSPKLEEWMSK